MKVEPGTVLQLRSGGPKMVAGRGTDGIQCFWVDEAGAHRYTFPAACLQPARSSAEQLEPSAEAAAEQAALHTSTLTAEQAELLKQWRAVYFDAANGVEHEAAINVLRLLLWGKEIKEPALKAFAENSEIGAATAELLEGLAQCAE